MIAYRQIIFVLGLLIVIMGFSMLIPVIIGLVHSSKDTEYFLISMFVCVFLGGVMYLSQRGNDEKLSNRDIFLLVVLVWITLPFMACIPFYISHYDISFTDAFFETVSGITTTGATAISGIDFMPPGILLWRSLLQWLGGIGIVVMASGVLSIMNIGGMQVLRMEFDSRDEKALPKTGQLAFVVTLIYLVFTMIAASLYFLFGMSGFDAINHAMTTMSTGGFSTHDESIGFFKNDNILITSIVFMIIASLPFMIIIAVMRGGIKTLFKDTQVRWFFGFLFFIVLIFVINNLGNFDSLYENILQTVFNVTSMMTGTGYATDVYDKWGHLAQPVLLFAMLIGGCAGSTTCGIKMFRLKVMWEILKSSFKHMIYPNGMFVPSYEKRAISKSISMGVFAYMFLFSITVLIFTSIFMALELDILTALSAAVTAISCVGPAFGDVIGPDGNYNTMSDAFKWVFIAGMLLGRLEIMSIVVLFTPLFWRK